MSCQIGRCHRKTVNPSRNNADGTSAITASTRATPPEAVSQSPVPPMMTSHPIGCH